MFFIFCQVLINSFIFILPIFIVYFILCLSRNSLLQYIEHTNDENLILDHDRLKQLRQNVKSVQENAEVGVKYMRLWEEFLQERRLGREEGLHEGRIAGELEGEHKAQAETAISFCF